MAQDVFTMMHTLTIVEPIWPMLQKLIKTSDIHVYTVFKVFMESLSHCFPFSCLILLLHFFPISFAFFVSFFLLSPLLLLLFPFSHLLLCHLPPSFYSLLSFLFSLHSHEGDTSQLRLRYLESIVARLEKEKKAMEEEFGRQRKKFMSQMMQTECEDCYIYPCLSVCLSSDIHISSCLSV